MPKPLAQSVRENIIYHKKNGVKNEEIVKWLRVSKASVKRIWRLYKETQTVEEKTYKRGRKPAISSIEMDKITATIRDQPDITLEELKAQFQLNISISALSRKLIKADLRFKKRRYSQRNDSAQMSNGFAANG